MAKYKPKLNWGTYYTNDLYYSDAYQVLTVNARNLLHCLMSEVDVRKVKKRKRESSYRYPNNGEVAVTERQFTSYFGCSKQTFSNARDQLIVVGCIRVTYKGGFGPGDFTKYKVLTLPHLPPNQQRWRKYPENSWEKDIPKSRANLVGNKTRFKKGTSGRKPKTTLNR